MNSSWDNLGGDVILHILQYHDSKYFPCEISLRFGYFSSDISRNMYCIFNHVALDMIQSQNTSTHKILMQSKYLPFNLYGSVSLIEFLQLQQLKSITESHVLKLTIDVCNEEFNAPIQFPQIPKWIEANTSQHLLKRRSSRKLLDFNFDRETICPRGRWSLKFVIEFDWELIPVQIFKQFQYIQWLSTKFNVHITFRVVFCGKESYTQFSNLLNSCYGSSSFTKNKFCVELSISNEDFCDESNLGWTYELKNVVKKVELVNIFETNCHFNEFMLDNNCLEHIEFVITEDPFVMANQYEIIKTMKSILYSPSFLSLTALKRLSFNNEIVYPTGRINEHNNFQNTTNQINQENIDKAMIEFIVHCIQMTDVHYVHINNRSIMDYEHLLYKICSKNGCLSRIRFTNTLPKTFSKLLRCLSVARYEIVLNFENLEKLKFLVGDSGCGLYTNVPLQIFGTIPEFSSDKLKLLCKIFGIALNDCKHGSYGIFYSSRYTLMYIDRRLENNVFAYIHHYPSSQLTTEK